jgi:hypothetical protein
MRPLSYKHEIVAAKAWPMYHLVSLSGIMHKVHMVTGGERHALGKGIHRDPRHLSQILGPATSILRLRPT